MTKKIICFLLAVLTVVSLAACGTEVVSSAESSAPEALQTFGNQVDPSAQPSAGEIISADPVPLPSTAPEAGDVTEGDEVPGNNGGGISESETVVTSQAPATTPTKAPAVSKKPTATPSPTPTIAPPEPVSSATADDATKFIGKTLSEFISAHGYPESSDYEYIDEEDPDAGEIGTVVFNGFVVKTKKTAEGEVITSVTKTGGPTTEPSPSTSSKPEASESPEISPDPEDPMAPTE